MLEAVRKAGLELKEEFGVVMQSWEKPICPYKMHEIISSILFNCTVIPEWNVVDAKLLADNRCEWVYRSIQLAALMEAWVSSRSCLRDEGSTTG